MKQYFENGRHYRIWRLNLLYPPYWDEGMKYHKSKKRHRKKRLTTQREYRASRTWKHTRNTQYKNITEQ